MGILDKLKEKKGEYDRRQEDRKVEDIQKQIDKRSKDFKKALDKKLGKLGLSTSHIDLWGSDPRQRKAGTIVTRFNDNEGYPITMVQTQELYQGTPFGASFEKRVVYCGALLAGSLAPVSIPYTLLFRNVGKGFLKGTERAFLPLTTLPFNEKELLHDPRLQEPLLASLNADRKLLGNIDRSIYGSTVVSLTHKCTMTVSCQDIGGRCLLIPAEGETCIFLRGYGYGGDNALFNLDKYVEIISGLRKHVLAHPHSEKVSGKIPHPMFNTMYVVCKAPSPKPSTEAVF
ncbi:MAG: hypothetical protein ACETV0_03485 [Nitrososphaeria archaeon]